MKRAGTLILTLSLILSISLMAFNVQVAAQEIDYDLDYSDPASDVTWVYENGTMETSSEPKDVNIKWIRSELQAGNETLKLSIELSSPGVIRTDNATIYQINIYTTTGNASHFALKYTDGICKLGTNITESFINETVDYSISGLRLDCFVNLSELGTVTHFNIDATAETREYENETVGWILKKDFGWEISGSPGSTPDNGTEDGGEDTPGFELITMVCATGLAFTFATYSRRRKE